jgi:hypothetical protein
MLALTLSTCTASFAAEPSPQPATDDAVQGRVFDWFDPTGEIRAAVDPAIAERLVGRIRAEARRDPSWAASMFESLSVMSSELQLLASSGALETKARPAIGAIAMISVLDSLVGMYPELASRVAAHSRTEESPIEKICSCDRGGSRACGCLVVSTGSGSCQYVVSCATLGGAFCSAVNFEMCVAREVIDVFM